MKSGNTIAANFEAHVDFRQFEGMHRDRRCEGQWQLTLTFGPATRFTIDVLGPVQVHWIPLITCHTCKTSYELPKFREFIERLIAEHLVRSRESLSKRQIRFLRLFFDQTQEEFASRIGVADKHEMSKIESEQTERTLGADRQVRLRLYCAKLLQIKDLDAIYAVNEIDDSRVVKITPDLFPSKDEASETIKKLA